MLVPGSDGSGWQLVIVFWHCKFLSFILMDIYLGASCFSLQVLLYHIAAFVLYSFSLMFLY